CIRLPGQIGQTRCSSPDSGPSRNRRRLPGGRGPPPDSDGPSPSGKRLLESTPCLWSTTWVRGARAAERSTAAAECFVRHPVNNLIDGEAGCSLAGREVLERLEELADHGRRGKDQVDVVQFPIVVGVGCDVGSFVRVGAQVEDLWHAQRDKR